MIERVSTHREVWSGPAVMLGLTGNLLKIKVNKFGYRCRLAR